MIKQLPTVLLLGCGYSLSRLARIAEPGSFVVTSRSEAQCAAFRDHGWLAETFSFDTPEKIQSILQLYPSLTTVIDGVPPPVTDLDELSRVYSPYLKCIGKHGLKVFYLSTTGVSGVDDGNEVNEATPVQPKSAQAKARLAVETLYNTLESTSFRLPAIYGPGRGIGHALKQGRYSLISDAVRWTNRIQVHDLASTLIKALSSKELPPVLYLCDDLPSTQKEVVEFYCSNFSLPTPKSITLEEAKNTLHHSQLSNQRVSNRLIKQVLNVSLQYPTFKEGAATEWVVEEY